MKAKSEILARRAVHHYRRYDTLAYVSLRLYLRNRCALRDRWSQEIASELVLNQNQPIYNHILEFKQVDQNGCYNFRDLHITGPNEILAETALLAVCADEPKVFQPPCSVYSYKLSSGDESQGVYRHYFYGFRNRHQDIATACQQQPDAVVIYTDIKKFYPSVKVDLAKNVWSAACKDSNLSERYRRLGMKILENHGHVQSTMGNNPALLTRPLFSHLIGNLVLRNIDLKMEKAAPGRYFRYVDDFVFVAPKKETCELEKRLKCMLSDLGLELHKNKRMEVDAERWLKAEHNFDDDNSPVSWKTFIGQLKQLLLFRPNEREEMESKFRNEGIRIRPIDYSEARQDRDFLSRIRSLAEYSWFILCMRRLSPDRIIEEGLQLRDRYMEELDEALTRIKGSDHSFDQKMCISRLRFLLPRLGYLATTDKLHTIAEATSSIKEMTVFAAMFKAMATRDVSELLKFGPKAAQAVAQPLKMDSNPVRCSVPNITKEVSQAYAILQLNKVPLEDSGILPENPMITFCREGNEVTELFESSDTYFRELACLHGANESDVLRRSLETAFDRDEDMVFDMMNFVYGPY